MAAKSNPILDEMHRLEAAGRTITSVRPIGAYPNFVARFRLTDTTTSDFKVTADAPYFAKWCTAVTRILADRRHLLHGSESN
jgi:hypothetical protein